MARLLPHEPQTQGRQGVDTSSSTFEDVRAGVRPKISALWIAMLFLYPFRYRATARGANTATIAIVHSSERVT